MNEELEQSNTENTDLILQLEELTNVLSTQIELEKEENEPETILVDGEEKTQNDILLEILEVLTPDEKQAEIQAVETENQMQALQAINDNLIVLNTTIENSHTEQIELMEEQKKENAEGSLMVSLSIVISFGVYMFWSQISKW